MFLFNILSTGQSTLFVTISDSTLGKIIRRHLDGDFVARKDLDVMHAHFTRDVGNDFMTILKLYAEHCVSQGFGNGSVQLYGRLFCH